MKVIFKFDENETNALFNSTEIIKKMQTNDLFNFLVTNFKKLQEPIVSYKSNDYKFNISLLGTFVSGYDISYGNGFEFEVTSDSITVEQNGVLKETCVKEQQTGLC